VNYREAVEQAMAELGGGVVMVPRAYAAEISDHLNELEGDGPEVDALKDFYEIQGIRTPATLVSRIDEQGCINPEYEAIIVSYEDYDKLTQGQLQSRR
jgi:hypothetical protein